MEINPVLRALPIVMGLHVCVHPHVRIRTRAWRYGVCATRSYADTVHVHPRAHTFERVHTHACRASRKH